MSQNEAYRAGYELGLFQRAMIKFYKELYRGFHEALDPGRYLTEEELFERKEARRHRTYLRQLDNERRLGRAYVKSQAKRVRQELGLPDY